MRVAAFSYACVVLAKAVYASNRVRSSSTSRCRHPNDHDSDHDSDDDDDDDDDDNDHGSVVCPSGMPTSTGGRLGLDRSAGLSHGGIAGVTIGALAFLALLALLAAFLLRRRRRLRAENGALNREDLDPEPHGAATPFITPMRMANVAPPYAPSVSSAPPSMHRFLGLRRDRKTQAAAASSQTSLSVSQAAPQAQFRSGFPPAALSTVGDSVLPSETGALDGHEAPEHSHGGNPREHGGNDPPPVYEDY